MYYQKSDTVVLTGNSGIPADLKTQYVFTLCFSLTHSAFSHSTPSEYNFFDISLNEEQLKDLHAKLTFYLSRLEKDKNDTAELLDA